MLWEVPFNKRSHSTILYVHILSDDGQNVPEPMKGELPQSYLYLFSPFFLNIIFLIVKVLFQM